MSTKILRRVLIVDDDPEKAMGYARLILSDVDVRQDEAPKVRKRSSGPVLPLVCVEDSFEGAKETLTSAYNNGEPFHVLVLDLFLDDKGTLGVDLLPELRTAGYTPETLGVVLVSTQQDADTVKARINEASLAWNQLKHVFRIDYPANDANGQQARSEHSREFYEAVWSAIWVQLSESAVSVVIGDSDRGASASGPVDGGQSCVEALVKDLKLVAKTRISILILGENGTGKGKLAERLHEASELPPGRYYKIECTRLSPNLIDSELFGYEKGAFTGAIKRKDGLVEQARGGTLFLDEIGELPLDTQGRLLGLLQDHQFRRVGGVDPIEADVRVIAATNRDLKRMVSDGLFREDLYYRLNGITVTMPPLRDRLDEIPHLAKSFWQQEYPKEKLPFRTGALNEDVLRQLQRFDWPGNVRELQRVIQLMRTWDGPIEAQKVAEMLAQRVIGNFNNERFNTFTQWAKHAVFSPRLKEALNKRTGQDGFLNSVKNDGGYWSMMEVEAKGKNEDIRKGLSDHVKVCSTCRLLALDLQFKFAN